MKSFEKFREEKSNVENKISKLIEDLCKEYHVELDDIEFDTFRIYADQETKSVSIKLKFDL